MHATTPLFTAISKTSSDVGTSGHGEDGYTVPLPQRRRTFIARKTRLMNGERTGMKRASTADMLRGHCSFTVCDPEPGCKRQKSELRKLGRRLRSLFPMQRAVSDAQPNIPAPPCTRAATDSAHWPQRKPHIRKLSLASLASSFLPSKEVSLPLGPQREDELESREKPLKNPTAITSKLRRVTPDTAARRRNRLSMLSAMTASSGKKSDTGDSDSWRRSSWAEQDTDDDPFRPPTPTYLREPGSAPASPRVSTETIWHL
ncbi:hypothetical protein HDZ31DRAFT_69522 [Schizophyllum fasciatum]